MLVLEEWGSWDDRQNHQPLRPGEGAITKTGKCSFAIRSHGSGVGLSRPASGRRGTTQAAGFSCREVCKRYCCYAKVKGTKLSPWQRVRGAVSIMAADLARLPHSNLNV